MKGCRWKRPGILKEVTVEEAGNTGGMELAGDMAFGDEEGVMGRVTGGWLPRW